VASLVDFTSLNGLAAASLTYGLGYLKGEVP